MSFSVLRNKCGLLPNGNGGSNKIQYGTFSFGAGDGTGDLPLQMSYVESLQLTPVGTSPPDDDQVAFVDKAVDTEGGFTVPASGKVTITQTGASPAAIKYFFFAIGY